MKKHCFYLFYMLLSACFSTLALAEELVLGVSNATSGPNKDLGTELNYGAMAYFENYNKTANVPYQIRLVTLNDGYEPNLTYRNTVKLIEEHKADILFNYVGTPTSKAIMPLLHKYKVPYFAPFTGANFLRDNTDEHIINIRASYYQEAEHQVSYFVDTLNFRKVAIFIQADDFGLEASKGFNASLKKRGIINFPELRYKRNTDNVDSAIKVIQSYQPDVIFTIGTQQPISKLIKYINDHKTKTKLVALSFTNSTELIAHIPLSTEFYFTTVVPNPWTSKSKIAASYRQAMEEKQYSFTSFEGYINAKILVDVLEKHGPEFHADKLFETVKTFYSTDPLFPLAFHGNQASRKTFLNHFTNGKITEINNINHN